MNDATSVLTVNGSLANSGTTTVQGTLSAAGVATTGVVEMQGGTLSSSLTVKNGGSLRGSGTTGVVSVEAGGTISPGVNTGAGLLHTGNLSLASGANFVMDLNGTAAGTQYDQVAVTGTVNLASSHVVLNLGFNPSAGNQFVLINNDSTDPISGTFNGLAEGATVMGFIITYAGGTGNDVVLEAVIPEPQTWVSLLSGFGLLLVFCNVKRGDKALMVPVPLRMPLVRLTAATDALVLKLAVPPATLIAETL